MYPLPATSPMRVPPTAPHTVTTTTATAHSIPGDEQERVLKESRMIGKTSTVMRKRKVLR